MNTTELAPLLERLATSLASPDRTPSDDHDSPMQLAGLLPCEPAIGPVALACWINERGDEHYELVRLDEAAMVVRDATALREACTLLAMCETLEELASVGIASQARDELAAWRDAPGQPVDTSALHAPIKRATEALSTLIETVPDDDSVRVARPPLLDAIGSALRTLELSWTTLEQHGERWSDEALASRTDDADVVEQVQSLWRTLALARRGPLSHAPSEALHGGREAGLALASAINGAAS
jgi:hypothetical protein